jgi:hypothetical protein
MAWFLEDFFDYSVNSLPFLIEFDSFVRFELNKFLLKHLEFEQGLVFDFE